MRYIGNKTKILNEIDSLLTAKGLNQKGLIFCDAFTGTASVAHHYKNLFQIIANDYLYYSYIWADARLNASSIMFEKLGINPFVYFNENHKLEGFVAQNYAPKYSGRMYFSDENAQRIDFIRTTINEWYEQEKINYHERNYLIASLLESVSKVANVAGVYGSYLKTWDPRAIKEMTFIPIDENPNNTSQAHVYNLDIISLIKSIKGDILYLDPPYTKNQYSVQYHLLETIALYDNPKLNGKTGARDMSSFSSSFSKQYRVNVLFEELVALADFKYIIMSYSSDGLMSKEYIEAVLKRYGKPETFELRKIKYSRYKNARAEDKDDHCEYLFYIEKKVNISYASPLNYIGGKYDMIDFIKSYLPADINTFYDLFGGGANIAINVEANNIIYNDINYIVKDLLQFLATTNIETFYQHISKKIEKYHLSAQNKDAYIALRNDYNYIPKELRSYDDLFLLIMYGFNQQIRFNSQHDYNNPVGMACFNENVLEKLISYSRIAKTKKIKFAAQDYKQYLTKITKKDFVYLDPPYLITLGSYNDGKRGFNGWTETDEEELYTFLTKLHKKGVRFMLSNVIEHKGETNTFLQKFITKNNLRCIEYEGKTRKDRKEIIVLNY